MNIGAICLGQYTGRIRVVALFGGGLLIHHKYWFGRKTPRRLRSHYVMSTSAV